ncbi:MAG TPA: VWA domain-containing protein [Pyrinomonadaceae bacterium]|nr:VWA domain-containing protein [Pyrinomonadaceae bacterium]
MRESNRLKLGLKFFALTLLVAGLLFFLDGKTQALLGARQSENPVVTAELQPDAPLHISSIEVSVSRPNSAQPDFEQAKVSAVITNISSKTICAFAISHGPASASNKSGVMFLNIMSLNQVLQPGQSKSFHIVSVPLNAMADGLRLAVDYTEFSDGTAWGPNKFDIAQQLSGQRAGASAAKAHSRKLLMQEGLVSVLNNLGSDNAADDEEISVPRGHSKNWEEGFRTGYKISRNRLRRAQAKGGRTELENELQQAYDALERRQNR